MINTTVVYKIKLTPLSPDSFVNKDGEWANGTNIYKSGGSGKTWTSKKLVNKNFNEIKRLNGYGIQFEAKIFTFNLTMISSSSEEI